MWETFQSVLRVTRVLFDKIHSSMIMHALEVPRAKGDAVGQEREKIGKLLRFLHMERMGASLRKMDDQLKISVETLRTYFRRFVKHVKQLYGGELLNRKHTCMERGGNMK